MAKESPTATGIFKGTKPEHRYRYLVAGLLGTVMFIGSVTSEYRWIRWLVAPAWAVFVALWLSTFWRSRKSR